MTSSNAASVVWSFGALYRARRRAANHLMADVAGCHREERGGVAISVSPLMEVASLRSQ
jgi:hypothetical protein